MLNLTTDKNAVTAKYRSPSSANGGGENDSFANNGNGNRMGPGLGNVVPVPTRDCYKVGIIGAGLAGLGCAQELLRLSKKKNLKLEVEVFEARNRIGGRCWTDTATFKTKSGAAFPIEMGASWIHGTTGNPLSMLAKAAGMNMRGASDNVKLLVGGMKEVDPKVDNHVSALFDEVLDEGVSIVCR